MNEIVLPMKEIPLLFCFVLFLSIRLRVLKTINDLFTMNVAVYVFISITIGHVPIFRSVYCRVAELLVLYLPSFIS